MPYEIVKLQNASTNPTIQITKDSVQWKEALKNWLNQQNPTNDPGGKRNYCNHAGKVKPHFTNIFSK